MAKRAARLGENVWKKRLADWKSSGQNQIHWCKAQNVSIKTFQRWKARLGFTQAKGKRRANKTPAEAMPTFVSVNVPPAAIPHVVQKQACASYQLTISVGKFSVQIAHDFDPALLKTVLLVLGEVA
ncbi:MAG: hypothetical protein KKE51_00135 [Gammaproteobacteria bacterium]|nr:hypothetical protein [Gammaproteobacteria bacterium]MBU1600399.1 hypothetical protein [Gammaproteobacteria bacterium]MBU2434855.1 hypothetical protein [Gammaproteobacteria bacterium]MBU2448091.1 hypothetical protein [Gammaproteobacteria bacterium]